jgi:hypothetical protein
LAAVESALGSLDHRCRLDSCEAPEVAGQAYALITWSALESGQFDGLIDPILVSPGR